ncbi:uncharacterized protein LOC129737877 [Uranotaenia lowii]|uniref:uncharacterized protein LOC129737877 n=1 Tax=Uranotaenia lowii TaxID=190385 RepID=UPI00247B0721|nr:uncharacterized protein LOC129737877 [Uranotaenia lowii]
MPTKNVAAKRTSETASTSLKDCSNNMMSASEAVHSCQADGCKLPDSSRMVACDVCDSWWHYECAGVDDSIADKDFVCIRCSAPTEKQTTIIAPAKSLTGSMSSASSTGRRAKLKLQKLEEMKVLQEKQLELDQRKLNLEKDFHNEKFRVLEEEVADEEERQSRKSNRSNSSQIIQWKVDKLLGSVANSTVIPLAKEAVPTVMTTNDAICVGGIQAPVELQAALVSTIPKQTSVLATEPALIYSQKPTGMFIPYSATAVQQPLLLRTSTGAATVGGVNTHVHHSIRSALMSTSAAGTPASAPIYSSPSGPVVAPAPPPVAQVPSNQCLPISTGHSMYPPQAGLMNTENVDLPRTSYYVPGSLSLSNPAAVPNPTPTHMMSHVNPATDDNYLAPSPSHIAARQVMGKDLPLFSGDPEDWTLFSSVYYNTSQACGYSNVENLSRLQRCLRGPALDAVSSYLLSPSTVPMAMENLTTLYGRPEILVYTLLKKLKETPPPKPDRLDSLISFGMLVQSLVNHIEAGQQTAHLNNPTLLFELVEKLPVNIQMDWGIYKQQFLEPNLRVFATFMSILIKAATQVTLPKSAKPDPKGTKSERGKERGFLHAHAEQNFTSASEKESREPTTSDPKKCKICSRSGHKIPECTEFHKKTTEERWDLVHSLFLCRTCLYPHGRRPCKQKKACGEQGCDYKHHPLLHTFKPSSPEAGTVNNHRHAGKSCLYRILPVTLHSKKGSVNVHAFLDDGSSLTLLEESVANQLGLEGETGMLCLTWTSNVTRDEANSKWVNVDIAGDKKSQQYTLSNIRTVQKLALPSQTLQYKQLAARYPHLSGLPVTDYENAIPKILIGNDNAHLAVPLRRRESAKDSPIATKTRLGWTIHGPVSEHNPTSPTYSMHICECSIKLDGLHDLVKRSFAVESLGISRHSDPESNDDIRARQILEATTKRVAQRFETGLLWRYDVLEFPDSFPMAYKRMLCLERRMQTDAIIGASVKRQISEYIEKGYLREATVLDIDNTDVRRTWYLPLGVVLNPKKPGKVRIFCDAAAKVDGISLNSMLLKGPDLLVSLPKVLFGFRERRIAVCADIREMFHRVLIRDEDINAQRILWREDPSLPPRIFLMKVATFGSTSSPCSVQHVKNLNAREFADRFPEAVECILNYHYMDDFLKSFDDEMEAAKRSLEVKYIHSQAGFEIHSWSSNSKKVLDAVGETDPTSIKKIALCDQTVTASATERILGMLWLREEDAFTYSSNLGHVPEWPTKREVLRVVMSLYDPLGLLSHFIVHGKILIQDIWRTQSTWDEPISETLKARWSQWIDLFQFLGDIRIPRPYFPGHSSHELSPLQLHVFVDASESAYACVSYLRTEINGEIKCALVSAKSKVAPLKTLSIPRLELQAAIIGSRLSKNAVEAHSLAITRRYFWTDSRTVLAWINSDLRKYNQFVSCRIGEILETTSPCEWRWIPTKLNVADEATKWGTGPEFSSTARWFNGPDFLYGPEKSWPLLPTELIEVPEERRSLKREVVNIHHVPEVIGLTIDWGNFSQWNRLLNAIGYVFRYVHNFCQTSKRLPGRSGHLEQAELIAAEKLIFRTIQNEVYSAEIAILREGGGRRIKRNSPLAQLSPFIDIDGVVRIESRISEAAFISYDTRNPIILPKKHHATELIVLWYHRKYLHCNTETIINELRQRFHVSSLRTMVRRIRKQCTHCQVYKASPAVPRMSPLPAARLRAFHRPFSFVGLDYFGPMNIRVGRSTNKRWVALFTCLTIRAVHLEVVHSLTTTSCKMAVRRFVGRRGPPVEIYSDNGTNFLGASNELIEECRGINKELAETFTNTVTKWCFNPPSAPHMGGAWERLVRSVKTAFFAMTTTKTPNEETFSTILVEAEALVNSRPLTFVSIEDDSQEALTPNHFLLLSSSGAVQPSMTMVDPRLANRDDWNHTRHLVDLFWHRWIKEYLPTIARRTKWFEEVKPIEPGDLVVIIDENRRNGWIRGRILDVAKGSDGRVRRATVQTSSGILKRPVAKIAVLDIGKPSMDH